MKISFNHFSKLLPEHWVGFVLKVFKLSFLKYVLKITWKKEMIDGRNFLLKNFGGAWAMGRNRGEIKSAIC